MRITLHNPDLDETIEVDETQVSVYAKGGWEPVEDASEPTAIAHSDKSADVMSGLDGAGHGDEEELDR